MRPDIPATDEALGPLRSMLRAASIDFRIIGGMAVVHHGYERLTVDLDVLIATDGPAKLEPFLDRFGFSRSTESRLVHESTGVRVDVLVEGNTLVGPRSCPPLPSPAAVGASPADPEVVSLAGLLTLKLDAGRRQDLTDVVELLKRVDELAYIHLEAAVRPEQRNELTELRDEALQELAWDDANE